MLSLIVVALLMVTIQNASAQNTKFAHGTKFQDCPDCPKMIVVRGDTFMMGSLKSEKDSRDRERPRHKVRIKTFAMGQYEVTRGQFHAFVKETGYEAGNKCWTFEKDGINERTGGNYLNPGFSQTDDHPVVCVSWTDAQAYVAWLSRKTGKVYRLLTEAEWEYVATTKKQSRYFFGDNARDLCLYGNGADRVFQKQLGKKMLERYKSKKWVINDCSDRYGLTTAPVGTYRANDFDLYDVHGNVLEWVEDCYHKTYQSAPNDGSAWLKANGGDGKKRVLRGGSWSIYPEVLRARNRNWSIRGDRNDIVGFRVARMP